VISTQVRLPLSDLFWIWRALALGSGGIDAVLTGSRRFVLLRGDNGAVLPALPDEWADAVVTDPPAGIGFMGRDWDSDKGGRDPWVAWLAGVMRECLRVLKPGGHALVWALPRTAHWTAWALEDAGFEVRDKVMHLFGSGFPKGHDVSKAIDKDLGTFDQRRKVREVVLNDTRVVRPGFSSAKYSGEAVGPAPKRVVEITEPASEEARRWSGWNTTLKPGGEDWILARKPLATTVSKNVVRYGTGAINVGACRYEGDRWPTNVVLSDGAIDELGEDARFFPRFLYCAKPSTRERNAGLRDDNPHPTVKPVALMRWLCRLVAPPGGVVLDPFAGSATTGVGALLEGFRFVGVEREPDYAEVAEARLRHAETEVASG